MVGSPESVVEMTKKTIKQATTVIRPNSIQSAKFPEKSRLDPTLSNPWKDTIHVQLLRGTIETHRPRRRFPLRDSQPGWWGHALSRRPAACSRALVAVGPPRRCAGQKSASRSVSRPQHDAQLPVVQQFQISDRNNLPAKTLPPSATSPHHQQLKTCVQEQHIGKRQRGKGKVNLHSATYVASAALSSQVELYKK